MIDLGKLTKQPATEKQKEVLRERGIPFGNQLTQVQANILIGKLPRYKLRKAKINESAT